MPPTPPLILASASPRRQSLLAEAGYVFDIHPAHIDEEKFVVPGALPADIAKQLAIEKANAVAQRFPDAIVLGADTIVAFGDQVLGKPKDADDARRILSTLSGTTHIVITGLAVIHKSAGFQRSARIMSAVRMKWLSPAELDRYIASGEWQGKAGAYGIQDADPFVTRVTGSQSNIVGLPLKPTKILLSEAGLPPPKP